MKKGNRNILSKRILFRIHSWIGINLSILFFIVCFSGTLATLSHEMDWLFIPEMRAKPQKEFASENMIAANLKENFPDGKIMYWERVEEPYLCNIIHLDVEGYRRYVFANQYTGEIQGMANLTFQRYFRDLHYYLFIPVNQIGNYIVLVFAFLLFTSLITSLCFYKKWYRKLFTLTTHKGPLVFFRSLHRLVGVWSAPMILVFSITGIWYFVERANVGNVSDQIAREIPAVAKVDSAEYNSRYFTYEIDYNRASQNAKKEIPGLEIGEVVPPLAVDRPLYINGKSHVPLVRSRANRVYLNPYDYTVIGIQKAENENTISWINDIADPIHFGYWGGLVTKIIWFIFGIAISALILTGIWISLRRNLKKSKKVFPYWEIFNWVGYLVVMGFMHHLLTSRYTVSLPVLLAVYVAWAVLIALTYYVFVIRLRRNMSMP